MLARAIVKASTSNIIKINRHQDFLGCTSERLDLFVAGRDQPAANQLNNLTDGHPPLPPTPLL